MSSSTGEKETARLEAFSDGVFAIAITLLILEIKVPELPEGAGSWDLGFALIKVWPSLMAFTFSFFAILVMWINHHGFFNLVHKASHRFFYANGFLLLMVIFVPLPTAVLAKYIETPAAKAAVVFYCLTYLLVNVAYILLWWSAAYRRRLIKPQVAKSTVARIRNAYLIGFPGYLFAAVLALFLPWVALALVSVLWILWALLDYRLD